MENKKNNTKLILKGIIGFLIYFLVSEFMGLPFEWLKIDLDTIPQFVKCIYTIAIEVIIITSIAMLFKDYLVKCFNDMIKNHKKYFKKYLKYWFIMLALMVISNFLIMIFVPGSSAANQDAINEMFKELPIFTFILSVILAPVLEEFAFRLSFRAIFKNKIIFILVSGLLFGSFHVIGTVEVWTDLLYIIPYSIPGFIFGYVYVKSDNIFTSMGLHFLHNGVLMSIQFILAILGLL